MKKEHIGKIGKVMLFFFFFFCMFRYSTNILYNKSDASNYRPFYNAEENFDILFLGTSVMTSGVSPLDLWHDYGFVSFNLANNGQSLPNNYYALKSALETQNPKLVVVDVTYIFKDDIEALLKASGEARLHQLVDNMPMGKTKIEAVFELVKGEKRSNYLLPLLYYHDRWKEITERDFEQIISINRGGDVQEISMAEGMVFDTSVFAEGLEILSVEDRTEYPKLSQEYIEKIVKLCHENNAEVLFVNFPSFAHGETNHGNGETLQRMWNKLYVTLDDSGGGYINCMHHVEEIGFDFVDDLRDWRHLSVSGNEKITAWLGEYIQETYAIPDRRKEADLRYWDSDYEKWCDYKREILENAERRLLRNN